MNKHAVLIIVLLFGSRILPAQTQEEVEQAMSSQHNETGEVVEIEGDGTASTQEAAVPIVRNGYVSRQVNVDAAGLNIPGDAANEPSVAINPTNPNNVVIGWRQFDTVLSNFRQAGYAYSFDAGAIWTFPGSIDPGVFNSDPVIRADPDGVFYHQRVRTAPAPQNFATVVYKSDDGGVSWTGPLNPAGADKTWIAVDTTGGIGRGNYYQAPAAEGTDCSPCPTGDCVPTALTCSNGDDVDTFCTADSCCEVLADGSQRCCLQKGFVRSTDGGATFERHSFFADPDFVRRDEEFFVPLPGTPTLDVDSLGNVLVAGSGVSGAFTPGPVAGSFCAADLATAVANGSLQRTISVYRSTNAQDSNQTPTFDTQWLDYGTEVIVASAPNPNGIVGFPVIKVDRSGGAHDGNVYILNVAKPQASADPLDIHFLRSNDGGQSFSAFQRINDDPVTATNWQWFPTMSVAPNGRIDVIWNDTRNSLGDFWQSELFYTYSHDGGATWAPSLPVSPPWFSDVGWPQQKKIGDYYDIESDADGAAVAYAATFNNEQDVYFVRVFPDCNQNGFSDAQDIENGTSADADADLIPDECALLAITKHPDSLAIPAGGSATFTCEAAGEAPLAFQWETALGAVTDGGGLSGATTSSLTISPASSTHQDSYRCVVTNLHGVRVSQFAKLKVLPPAGVYDPVLFGARCDGQTDDTHAIQEAVDRAAQDGGGRVELPAGVCVVRASPGIDLTDATAVSVVGKGAGVSTIKAAHYSGSGSILVNIGSSEVRLSDFTLDGGQTLGADLIGVRILGLSTEPARRVAISGLELTGFGREAIELRANWSELRISDNTFHGYLDEALFFRGDSDSTHSLVFSGNVIDHSASANPRAVHISFGGLVDSVISHNLIEGGYIDSVSLGRSVVDSNVITNSSGHAFRMTGDAGAVTFSNNTLVTANDYAISVPTNDGPDATLSVLGNRIRSDVGGVSISKGSNLEVFGNTFSPVGSEATGDGIAITAVLPVNNVTVAGNVVRNFARGIAVSANRADLDTVMVADNIVRSSVTGAVGVVQSDGSFGQAVLNSLVEGNLEVLD